MSLIKITSFARRKNNSTVSSSTTVVNGFATSTPAQTAELETHSLWGNEFNGTQDINGSMEVNGTIYTSDGINTDGDITTTSDIHADGDVYSNSVNTGTLDATNGDITNFTSDEATIQHLISTNGDITNLNVDVLNAKQAHFWELVIDKMRSTNGSFILSPANARIEKVVANPTERNYKLMWRAQDINTGKAITNDFVVNDQIICMSFNQADSGTQYDVDNKYYWALVTSIGTESMYDELMEQNVDYHYITVGGTQRTWDGTLNPEIGDEICVLGNRNDTDRQNAIILSSVSNTFLDEDLEAPSIAQYKGINTFHLKPYRLNCLSGNENTFYGNFNVITGNNTTDVKDLINDSKSNIASIQTDSLMTFVMADSLGYISNLNAATGLVKKIEIYLGNDLIPTNELQPSTYVEWNGQKLYPTVSSSNPNIRNGIDINEFVLNQNDIEIDWLFSGSSYQPTNTECVIYVNFIHNGTTYEKLFSVPATVISTEKGTDAQFDRLVIDDFSAIVAIDDKLSINATAYIQHVKGDQITRLTDLSQYSLDAVSNAGDTFTFNKTNYFYYSNASYKTNYSAQQTKQNMFTVRLFKGTEKIDEQVFNVVFDSGAIFQVKEDAINSAVQSSKQYTDGNITTVSNSISQVRQTAEQISTRVTNIENDYVTSSELTQTSDNIQLNVFNSLNEKTGIDVSSGTITLNANNTNIIGNLNLYKTNQNGITLYDEEGVQRVIINSDSIGDLTDFPNDSYGFYNGTFSGQATSYNQISNVQSIGTFDAGTTLDIDLFNVNLNSNNGGTVSYPTQASANLLIQIIKNDIVFEETVQITKVNNYGVYTNSTDKLRVPIKESGNYYVRYTTSGFTNVLTNSTVNIICNARFQNGEEVQTYIGKDGFYSHVGSNKLLWLNQDEMRLQYGFSGFRFTLPDNNSLKGQLQVIAGVHGSAPNYKNVYLPFYNYTPIFSPATFNNGTIINTNSTNKYYYQIDATKDYGLCVMVNNAVDIRGNNKETWLLLPKTIINVDGEEMPLPIGYTVTVIKMFSGVNLYVAPSTEGYHTSVIVDSHMNSNYSIPMNDLNQTRETFVYIGKGYGQFAEGLWCCYLDH